MINKPNHIISNAKNGNLDAAAQLLLNYRDGKNGFEKNEVLAQSAFDIAVDILNNQFYLTLLDISNFKKIYKLRVKLHSGLTVFIGQNGVGKTTILEAIRRNLMWIAAHTVKSNSNGGRIVSSEIHNKSKEKGIGAAIHCELIMGANYKIRGSLACPVEGTNSNLKSEYINYRNLGKSLRIINDFRSINLPLFGYYGIDRLQTSTQQLPDLNFDKIKGYEDCLKEKTEFDVFNNWLVQLLKVTESPIAKIENNGFEKKIKALLNIGANDPDHPLYSVYLELKNQKLVRNISPINNEANAAIQVLTGLFKEVYPNLTEIILINHDDGKDKVALSIDGDLIFLNQFSDGQRVLFGLLGDIARRLIMLNDVSDEPLKGHGIILIDEIELHLHPEWQQKIVLILKRSFPNLQFIITTHSPHVITTVEPECIRVLSVESGKNKYDIPNFSKGAESHVVLRDIFEVNPRPVDVNFVQWLDEYTGLVNDNKWDSDKALELRQKLDGWGKNRETELDRLDMEIALKNFKRSRK